MAGSRTRASRALTSIPSDFPHAHRLGGSELFRTVLGGVPRSTFARWLASDVLPAPTRVAGMNLWPEQAMAKIMREGTRNPANSPDAALT